MTTRFRSINTVRREIDALTRQMNALAFRQTYPYKGGKYRELRLRREALLKELRRYERINAAEQATIVNAEAR